MEGSSSALVMIVSSMSPAMDLRDVTSIWPGNNSFK